MKNYILALSICILSVGQYGCAAVMAAKQPPKKDLSVFATGIPRNAIIAEIGAPVASEVKAGKRVEIFTFNQGYSTANRVSRTIFHGVADVATLGLWEVVGTPTEAAFDGKQKAFEVTYDHNDRAETIIQLQ